MWLDEHDAKTLLARAGIAVPPGQRAATTDDAAEIARTAGGPVYVKALGTLKNRQAHGGVVRAVGARETTDAFIAVTRACNAQSARVERAYEGSGSPWYLSMSMGRDAPDMTLLISRQGGGGIEARRDTVVSATINRFGGVRPFHVRNALHGTSPRCVTRLVEQCYDLMIAEDALLIELNPVIVDPDADRAIALDAHVVLDDHALFRHEWAGESESGKRHWQSLEAQLKSRGFDYVALEGDVGILGLGAGLTMHLVDRLIATDQAPAYFLDATGAAIADWPALHRHERPNALIAALRTTLEQLPAVRVLLVNFTSGGTPVDGLCTAVLAATSDLTAPPALAVHVDGNSRDQAKAILIAAGAVPQPSIEAAIAACALVTR